MPEFSVVIIVKGRRRQLTNVLDSIQRATILPCDIQVVAMDDGSDIREADHPRVQVHQLTSSESLPLAAARNAGIARAQTDTIIFLDVDCIASPTLFENMLQKLDAHTIVSAYPLYLSEVPDSGSFVDVRGNALEHPDRRSIASDTPVDHLLFWSLIFAVERKSFERIRGFDESFTGYGAEDTDFAMSFHRSGMSLVFIKDYVLHQYHPKYDPPYNHFDAINTNARRYHAKWHKLPMGRWLRLFAEAGMISIDTNDNITIIRQPTQLEIDESLSKEPY